LSFQDGQQASQQPGNGTVLLPRLHILFSVRPVQQLIADAEGTSANHGGLELLPALVSPPTNQAPF
jgi:hypothetical protein